MENKMEKKKVIYLAGHITGNKQYRLDFLEAEDLCRVTWVGCVVLNPARTPVGLDTNAYMDIAFAQIRASNSILMLSNWEGSQGGAQAELAYAKKLGKNIYYQQKLGSLFGSDC